MMIPGNFLQDNEFMSPTKEKPMKQLLHVGCGQSILRGKAEFNAEEYNETRLDIDSNVFPDICCSMLDMSQVIPPDSYDLLYSSHNLEHLYPHEVVAALNQFIYVLKPEGKVIITCPDLMQVAQKIVSDGLLATAYEVDSGPVAPIDMLYGYTNWLADSPYMAHKTGFTSESLKGYLELVGFRDITVVGDGVYTLWAYCKK